MTGHVEALARADRILAALDDEPRSAQAVAEAIGTVACSCIRRPNRLAQHCPCEHLPDVENGWRLALVADVRPILNRLEKVGTVKAHRMDRRTLYSLAVARAADGLDDRADV